MQSSLSSPVWYLGIDFGTTGISAALLNSSTGKVYPISWLATDNLDTASPTFRLPVVGSQGILLKHFKPYLKVALPYYCNHTNKWEPVFGQSPEQEVSLHQINQAVQELLATLNPLRNEQKLGSSNLIESVEATTELQVEPEALNQQLATISVGNYNSQYAIAADGLDPETLRSALGELTGIIVSSPADCPEAYRFNLRENILASGLVASADQIAFVEEAIATFLAEVHCDLSTANQTRAIADFPHLPKQKLPWQGATLIIHAGASTTELALVNLPPDIRDLTYTDFTLRSFPYAGAYLDQDIVCQLLLNAQAGKAIAQQVPLLSANLDFPLPGEPDLPIRYLLQQKLESSPVGKTLLESAQYLKIILSHQDSFTLEIGEYRWVARRQDLENRVFTPFIQRLNRELNTLLARLGIPVEAIQQAICTGGTALLPSLSNWLRQKLPNAKLIKDEEEKINQQGNDFPYSFTHHPFRVALGLAALPLYPQFFNESRQQYNDYFLLAELLRVFGEEPLTIGQIMRLLERKGINTRACFSTILGVLEGYLPPGLVPTELEADLLSKESWQNPDYQGLTAIKPFIKEDNQTYRLQGEYTERLNQYLQMVQQGSHQKLAEPLALYWVALNTKYNHQ